MKLNDINLDDFDREEYIHFLKMLIEYYYIQYDNNIQLLEGE